MGRGRKKDKEDYEVREKELGDKSFLLCFCSIPKICLVIGLFRVFIQILVCCLDCIMPYVFCLEFGL